MALVQELLQELPVRNYLYRNYLYRNYLVQELPVRQAGPAAGLSRGCSGSRCCNWLLGLRRLGWRVEGGALIEVEGAAPHLKSGRC